MTLTSEQLKHIRGVATEQIAAGKSGSFWSVLPQLVDSLTEATALLERVERGWYGESPFRDRIRAFLSRAPAPRIAAPETDTYGPPGNRTTPGYWEQPAAPEPELSRRTAAEKESNMENNKQPEDQERERFIRHWAADLFFRPTNTANIGTCMLKASRLWHEMKEHEQSGTP